jgi:hypothetical protein
MISMVNNLSLPYDSTGIGGKVTIPLSENVNCRYGVTTIACTVCIIDKDIFLEK